MKRRRALELVAATSALAGCGLPKPVAHNGVKLKPISVGSKDYTEELILGEMYAALLENAGFEVRRRLNLAGLEVAMEALQRGDIDILPEYTGTAISGILKEKPSHDGEVNYQRVKAEYAKRFNLVWLKRSPFNDSQALATTPAVAAKYHLRTLTDLSKAAPQLRLGAIPEFTKRDDALPGLQRAFGGFNFKEVKLFSIGLKYQALESGAVDVTVAFGTDGQIARDHLVLFVDDTHFWPEYNVAPVVRASVLAANPKIAPALDRLAPLLTDSVMRGLNERVDGDKQDPADVAHDFLISRKLL